RVEQVLPASRDRQLLLGDELGVVAERENAAIDAGDAVPGDLGFAPCPVVELAQIGRLVGFEQAFFRGLQECVARSRPPDVAPWIAAFGLDLGEELTGRFLSGADFDAGRPLEADRHALAPRGAGRAAVHGERALRQRAGRDDEEADSEDERTDHGQPTVCLSSRLILVNEPESKLCRTKLLLRTWAPASAGATLFFSDECVTSQLRRLHGPSARAGACARPPSRTWR